MTFATSQKPTVANSTWRSNPGPILVAGAGAIVANVNDVVDTGADGYTFAKVDTGMTEFLRPNLYGAQHPISIFPADPGAARDEIDVLIAGHCCESGDMLTPAPGDPEGLAPRRLTTPGDRGLHRDWRCRSLLLGARRQPLQLVPPGARSAPDTRGRFPANPPTPNPRTDSQQRVARGVSSPVHRDSFPGQAQTMLTPKPLPARHDEIRRDSD